jgi:hypothetical protein
MDESGWTRAAVVNAAEDVFGKDSVNGILKLLDEYASPHEGNTHRVHLAIIKLSKGNIDMLRYNIEQAQKDFRDVLYWAEYYNDAT